MNRRARNKLCIWIIILGLLNCLAYTVVYAYIGGDAKNGEITPDGRCMLRGHFIHSREGRSTEVARPVWIYSSIHSISIWPTQAAVLIAMLILARPHIIATMKEDSLLSGPVFVTVAITIVALVVSVSTMWFILDLMAELKIRTLTQVIVVAVIVGAILLVMFLIRGVLRR